MSLVEQFRKLPETKILMLEVSTGKRRVLLKKIAKEFHKDRGEDELYKRVVWLIDNQPEVVERFYGQFDKFAYSDTFKRDDAIRDTFGDIDNIIHPHYAKIDNPSYVHEKMWGLVALLGVVKLFKDLEAVDPTKNMKYGNWLIDSVLDYAVNKGKWNNRLRLNAPNTNTLMLLKERGTFYEDLPKLDSYLKAYDEAKKKNELPEELRDITTIVEDFQDLYPDAGVSDPLWILHHVTSEFRAIKEKDVFKAIENNLKEGVDYEKLADDIEGFSIYQPETIKAQSIIGMGSEWCTTYGEYCTNPDYQARDSIKYEDLYILLDNSDPKIKYQFHFPTEQFMDIDDAPIGLIPFFEDHQEVFEFFVDRGELEIPSQENAMIKLPDIDFKRKDGNYFFESKYGLIFIAKLFMERNNYEEMKDVYFKNKDKRKKIREDLKEFMMVEYIANEKTLANNMTEVHVDRKFAIRWILEMNGYTGINNYFDYRG